MKDRSRSRVLIVNILSLIVAAGLLILIVLFYARNTAAVATVKDKAIFACSAAVLLLGCIGFARTLAGAASRRGEPRTVQYAGQITRFSARDAELELLDGFGEKRAFRIHRLSPDDSRRLEGLLRLPLEERGVVVTCAPRSAVIRSILYPSEEVRI